MAPQRAASQFQKKTLLISLKFRIISNKKKNFQTQKEKSKFNTLESFVCSYISNVEAKAFKKND